MPMLKTNGVSPKDRSSERGSPATRKQQQQFQPIQAIQLEDSKKHNDMKSQHLDEKHRSIVQRTLTKLNRKRRRLRSKLNKSLSQYTKHSYDNMEYAERQNSVATLDLFKYATFRERVAVGLGVMFMWYAASWQPISVFILAIMASLMGQYSKQVSWLEQLGNSSEPAIRVNGSESSQHPRGSLGPANPDKSAGGGPIFGPPVANPAALPTPPPTSYASYAFLSPLHSIVTPLFDHDASAGAKEDQDSIKAAVHDILKRESNQFLRKSFEINGSAFVLALTQLCAFFVGMTLITWAAKKQASRVKILYFRSSLHQEVTWFEAIDSASGSGSSLNALVEKYEDGIGMKLALLSYFIGHVGLFALTAFYQMFKLAAFCMPFVLVVGLVIAYLSELQAVAIGQQALFSKRSLQLAEEILAAIRTVFAFNGQQKEMTRYSISLQPVYRKSLIKHLYTALNTSLSKFSIFACFAAYCFYAMRLFPPYDDGPLNKSTVLAVMRGAEVSIVNILISIPFMEALQQSKGSIARIYAAIERRSKINPSSERGAKLRRWQPSISFRMIQFGYADRSGPTRRRSTLPFLNLPGSPGSGQRPPEALKSEPNVSARRQSLIDELADELELQRAARNPSAVGGPMANSSDGSARRSSAAIKRMIGGEIEKFTNKRVLNYFNLEIKAGQSVALVGPSGSGKSTVLSLVQRLYDITGGQLLIGQHNIKDLSVAWLRNQIGVVTQEPRLFDMSIAENIRLGLSNEDELKYGNQNGKFEPALMQQVIEAARAANAHDFISRLPNGYNTRVGSGGVQLSGGQKQRIAIARALIRKPKILLLDEATSALDTESEAQVQEALKAASVDRTTLIVAHRLATIKHVDLIVVMSQGQVVECGSHEELLARNPSEGPAIYKQMYEDQLAAVVCAPLRLQVDDFAPPLVQPKQKGNKTHQLCELDPNKLKLNPLERALTFSEASSSDGGEIGAQNSDHSIEHDDNDDDDDDDDDEEEDLDDASSGASSDFNTQRVSAWQLWQFVEMPKWSSLAAALICFLSGLILPINLIAHSYLFSAFAYNDLEQIGDYLHLFGLVILSFSTFVFIVSFLQVILPGYVGEKMSVRLRVKTMDSLLSKPMFYFDMDANSAGALCDRLNSYISNIQSMAGTRVATILEAMSTLAAGAFFGFGQNLRLSLFCLSFALLVLLTTIIESRIVQLESSLQQKFDAQLAHLMADALSNIKTIASLNKERFFTDRFSDIIRRREVG